MKNKTLQTIVLSLIIGALVSFAIFNTSNLSIKNIRTPSFEIAGTDKDVSFANNLGFTNFIGAWIHVSGEEIVNELNSVSIDCFVYRKTCEVAQANIVGNIFSNNISYFEIVEWSTTGQITATSDSLCNDEVLKADIKTKVVTLTSSSKVDAEETICSKRLAPIVLKLGSRGF